MEKRSLKLPFFVAAVGIYGFGLNAKLLQLFFSYDIYAHMGDYAQHIKYQLDSIGGAATICCLSQGIAEDKIIPKLKPFFNSIANKGEEIAVAFAMTGLTTLEILQSLAPKAKFDWQDMSDYTLACLMTYALGKYDQKRGVSMSSKFSSSDVPPNENAPH